MTNRIQHDPYPTRGRVPGPVEHRSRVIHARVSPEVYAALVRVAAEESARLGRTVTLSGVAAAAIVERVKGGAA